jgi:hypothetical protein
MEGVQIDPAQVNQQPAQGQASSIIKLIVVPSSIASTAPRLRRHERTVRNIRSWS